MTMRPPQKNPCNECPWRRNSWPGYLGPYDPETWIRLAQSDQEIACHKTIPEDFNDEIDALTEEIQTCAGAEIFRANICKSARFVPRENTLPGNKENVFSWGNEFIEHHFTDWIE